MNITNAIIIKFINTPKNDPQLIIMGPIENVAVFHAPPYLYAQNKKALQTKLISSVLGKYWELILSAGD